MSSSQKPQGMVPSDATLTQPASTANGPAKEPELPKLPLPKLEDTCKRYLRALEALQDEEEHQRTKGVVREFLESGEGSKWHKKLEEYNDGVDSYIEEFWYESYLSFADSVVLSLVSGTSQQRGSVDWLTQPRTHFSCFRELLRLRLREVWRQADHGQIGCHTPRRPTAVPSGCTDPLFAFVRPRFAEWTPPPR